MKMTGKPHLPMSQKAYLIKPCQCPNCHSDQIEGKEVNIDGKEAWQEIVCFKCGASWQDVYKLEKYENLTLTTTVQPIPQGE